MPPIFVLQSHVFPPHRHAWRSPGTLSRPGKATRGVKLQMFFLSTSGLHLTTPAEMRSPPETLSVLAGGVGVASFQRACASTHSAHGEFMLLVSSLPSYISCCNQQRRLIGEGGLFNMRLEASPALYVKIFYTIYLTT